MADNSVQIARIQKILRNGVRTVVVDGVTTTFDFEELRRQLRELMASDDTHRGRRPVISTIDLNRAF